MAAFHSLELAQEWQRRAGRVDRETRNLVKRTGRLILKVSKQHMRQQIYSIPEDTTAAGRKKWVRTRDLLKGEKLLFAADGSAVTLTNEVVYARARHELGRDGRQTTRPAHWREGIFAETLEEVRVDMLTTRDRIFRSRRGG